MNRITDINPFLGIEFCAINKVPSVTLKFDWTIENYDVENKGVCKSPDIVLPDVTLAFVLQRFHSPDSDECDILFVKSNSDKIHLSGIVVLHEKKFEFDRRIDDSKKNVFLTITKVPNKPPRFDGQPIPVKALFDVKVFYLDKKNYTFTHRQYGMSMLEKDHYRQEFQNNVQEMWRNPLYSDVGFVTGSNSISAHKNILSAGSPVFASKFQNTLSTPKTTYVFDTVPFEALEPFLGYFYGQIPNFEEIQDVKTLCALYHLSDHYKVLSLRDMCGQVLFSRMTAENVDLLLNHFKRYKDDEFMKECIKFCSKQLNSVESEKLRNQILSDPEFLSLVLKEMIEPKVRTFNV